MAILFLWANNNGKTDVENMSPKKWLDALQTNDPHLDIRIWPDYGDAADIDFIIAWHYPPAELKKFPNLRCIASLGAGVDHIISDKDRPLNVPIVRIVDPAMAIEMTHYVVASCLYFIKRLDHWQQKQQQHRWYQRPPFSLKARVGILGSGHLSQHAANALVQLGFTVSAWGRRPKDLAPIEHYAGEEQLSEFLAQTQILVCMLPLTPNTQGILNHKTFSQLVPGSYLINVARGAHLVEADLLEALANGQLNGAYLDVFATEPLPEDHPFWSHPNIHLTPHIASVTNPETAAGQIVENYHRLQQQRDLIHQVDLKLGY